MNALAQAFLGGICGFAWVVGFVFGVVGIIGVIGLLFTLIGVLFGGEPKNGSQE